MTWKRTLLSATLGILTTLTFLIVVQITFHDLVIQPILAMAETAFGYAGSRFILAAATIVLAAPPSLVIHRILSNRPRHATRHRMSSLQWITFLMAATFTLTLMASTFIVALRAPSGPLLVAILFAAQLALGYLLLKAKQESP